jgi:hypothetical protein
MLKNDHEDEKKLYIDVSFGAQEKHKPNVVPRDFLQVFCEVDSEEKNNVIEFCKSYGLIFWSVGQGDLVEWFRKYQKIYKPIIQKVIYAEKLSLQEIDKINEGLESMVLKVAIKNVNQIDVILKNHPSYTIENLSSVYTSQSFEAEICHLIWQKTKGKNPEEDKARCKICGDILKGRSPNYCKKKECRKEFRRLNQQIRYKINPEYRNTKLERAKKKP